MSLSETRPSDRTAAAVQIKGWRVGELVLDTVLMRVLRDGVPLAIDRRGIDLLFHLAENAGRTVSKDALIAVAWPGRVVSENSLVKAISKLRQALGDGDGDCLQVVHGYGYRLVCVVESLAAVHEAIREPAVETPAGHAEAVANQSRHWLHAGGLLLVLLGLLWAVVLLTDIETKDRTATDACADLRCRRLPAAARCECEWWAGTVCRWSQQLPARSVRQRASAAHDPSGRVAALSG
jgi:DNA-binding winged helix-turn-helix (wHTH) protein